MNESKWVNLPRLMMGDRDCKKTMLWMADVLEEHGIGFTLAYDGERISFSLATMTGDKVLKALEILKREVERLPRG